MDTNNTPAPQQSEVTPQPQPAPAPPANVIPHAEIEKARLEERTKLRQEIEATKAEAEKSKAALEALTKSVNPQGGVDVEKLIAETVAATVATTKNELAPRVQQLEEELSRERELRKSAALSDLRTRLIAEAGGPSALIPELVRGSDEAQLRASVEESKKAFQRIYAQATAKGGAQPSANLPSMPSPEAANGSASGAASGESPVSGRLSLSEYAKRREQLLASTKGRYVTNPLG